MARKLGTAGGTVYGGKAGEIGSRAERTTARLLSAAPPNTVVMHDLSIPGSPANIDHAVIVGDVVWLLDTKSWKPGWYITVLGRTWRKWRPWVDKTGAYPADKLTMSMAKDRLGRGLPDGIKVRCAVVVQPSTKHGRVHIALYRPRGAKAWSVARLERWVAGIGPEGSDPAVVAAMRRLVRLAKPTPPPAPGPRPAAL